MTLMTKTITAALTLGMVGLVACGDDDSDDRVGATVPPGSLPTDDTDTDTEDAAPAVDDAAAQYFDLLATQDLSRMGGMLELTPEASPAHLYAAHQIALVRADPFVAGAATNEWSDDSVRQCFEGYDEGGDLVEECFLFADFELADELLVSFTVDGSPIDERISTGEAVEADGVAVRVVTAYEAARGALFLNVDVTNNREGALTLAEYDWVYTTADGRQVEVADYSPTSDVGPGATSGTIAMFLQTPIGGTLRFVGFADEFVTEIRVEVPVPPGGR